MKRTHKMFLAIVGSLAAAVLLGQILAPFLVNVERFRPRVQAGLRAVLGRDVALGALSVSLWTGPAVRAASLRIGPPLAGSADGVLSLEAGSTSVHLAWLPLLRRDVQVRSITIEDLCVTQGGRPLVSGVKLTSRLRIAPDGTVEARGSMDGLLAALTSAPRVRAHFAAALHGGTLEIDSLDGACGPMQVEGRARLSGVWTPTPRLGIDGSARLPRTNVNGRVTVDLTSPHPKASFELIAPLLDADELMTALATVADGGSAARSSGSWLIPATNAASDLAAADAPSFMRALEVSGTMRAERCVAHGLEATDLSSRVSMLDGRALLDETRLTLYGGTAKGVLSFRPFEARTPFTLDQMAAGIAIRPLIAAFAPAQAGTVDGKASLDVHLTGDVATLPSLSGEGRLAVEDGTIANVGVVKQVLKALESVGARGIVKDETPFDHLSARFDLAQGVASTKNLEFRSRDLDFDGAGTVVLGGAMRLDVVSRFSKAISDDLVQATHALSFRQGADGRLSVPLQIRGTIRDPRVQLDLNRVLNEGVLNELKKLLGR